MTVDGRPDPIAQRLVELATELQGVVGEAAEVFHRPDLFAGAWDLTPHKPGALPVTWLDYGTELQVETMGGPGGRWELDRSMDDVAFLGDLVRSVIAGRVTEVRVANRSRVTVTLHDGSRVTETGYDGLPGCLPLPFWPRWGRRIQYEPYI